MMRTDAVVPGHVGLTEPALSLLAGIWASILEREAVEPQDSFFEIGGDSISAVLVLLHLEEITGLQVQPAVFFRNPRLGDLARAVEIMAVAPPDARQAVPRLARPGGATFPLSPSQRQLWFLNKLYPGSAAYNVPLAWRAHGTIDQERLAAALDGLVARHEILRTVYLEDDGMPRQRVLPQATFPFGIRDLTAIPGDALEDAWRREVDEFVAEPFDLESGPVIRARLLVLGSEEAVLVACVHHIAFDGWSAGILLNDLSAIYSGEPLSTALQYADYAAALADELDGPTREDLVAHWRHALDGIPVGQELPVDHPRRTGGRGRASTVAMSLEGERLADLTRLAREIDTTLFVVILAALTLLVSRATRQRDVVIGTPMANRGRPELLDAIGFFVDSLVLRNAVESGIKVGDFIAATGRAVQAAFDHRVLPFDLLVEALSPQRTLGHNPIFNVMIALQQAPGANARLGDAVLSSISVGNPSAKFDLMLNVTPRPERIELAWEYDTHLFERSSIEALTAQFGHVVARFADNPGERLDAISLRPSDEEALIARWNATERPLAVPSIVEAFASSVVRRAGDVALVEGTRRITYAELADLSDDLAERLQRSGVGPGEVIGLLLPRGIAAVLGMLAILKAGATYLPIDPELPRARIAFMAADANLRHIIVDNAVGGTLDGVMVVPAEVEGSHGHPVPMTTGPRHPCYLMYTSGSTGNPKGVLIPQEGILRLVLNPGFVDLDEDTVMLHSTSISFDTSTFEIWGGLLNGGRVVIYADRFDAREVATLMRDERVNVLWMTSGVLEVFAGALDRPLPDLRWLVAGGDVVPPKSVALLYRQNPNLWVVNGYGPTENSVLTCCHLIPRDFDTDRAIPIGRPIVNTVVEVLDLAGQPAASGMPGELVCAGAPVGLGYHNREELNAERFPSDPDRPGLRRYRTGDLVRRRIDGTIEFYGRLDNQLKIRGYRIEPAEIEAALQRYPNVSLGAITVHGEGAAERFLVGWVKPVFGRAVDAQDLRAFLADELPAASRPAHLRIVDEIPTTVNGKVDRRILAERFKVDAACGRSLPLHGSTQIRLAEIWSWLLGLDGSIGPDDHFFDLGGNSLLAVRLVTLINEVFGSDLRVRAVFETPCLSGLAQSIETAVAAVGGTPNLDRPAVERLVCLSRGKASDLWVGFPGVGASSASFHSLAQSLAADGGPGLSVLESRGLLPDEKPHESLADMAREAASVLLAEPVGHDITLVGHSLGGRVAFEAARELAARGRVVNLVLLDSLPGNTLVDVSFTDQEDSDEEAARWLLHAWGADISDQNPITALCSSGLVSGRQVEALLAQTRAAFKANRAYRPSGTLSSGRMRLVYAEDSLIGSYSQEAVARDLHDWCPGAEVIRVPGDHFSMLRDGHRLSGVLVQEAHEAVA